MCARLFVFVICRLMRERGLMQAGPGGGPNGVLGAMGTLQVALIVADARGRFGGSLAALVGATTVSKLCSSIGGCYSAPESAVAALQQHPRLVSRHSSSLETVTAASKAL